jgi:hypothetical protein
VAQNGQTGDWHAVDTNGNAMQVTTAGDGWLEIRHAPNGEEDPDRIQMQTPLSRDAGAGKAFEARMKRRALTVGQGRRSRARVFAGYAELLRQHYRRWA